MDFSLKTLGCPLTPLTAIHSKRRLLAPPSHDTLPKQRLNDDTTASRSGLISYLQECLFSASETQVNTKTLSKMLVESFCDSDDDETLSTVSSTDVSYEEEDFPLRSSVKSVSFAKQLVTEVHTRPATTASDKYYLYYSDVDYLDFKIGFVTGRDRTRKVSFARDVVSQVTSIPDVDKDAKQNLFYSETELQR